jgi:16S rRNA (guanine966-N2)-methyltransferase
MRIVGGRFRSRPLAAPRSSSIRPTGDRLRESLFNILEHAYGLPTQETRVLDLFAGTGALGLEAISRGAAAALFVETGVEARALIRQNVEALGLTGATRLLRRDATSLGGAGTIAPFDLVFCDPPYGKGFGERALASAAEGGWLAEAAVCVLEERADVEVRLPPSLAAIDRRITGDSQLIFTRHLRSVGEP